MLYRVLDVIDLDPEAEPEEAEEWIKKLIDRANENDAYLHIEVRKQS